MSLASDIARDTCTAHKPLGGVDGNGKPRTGHDPDGVPSRGSWGGANSRDLEQAGRQNVEVTSVYGTEDNLGKNYVLKNLRGRNWLVTHVHPTHLRNRCFLVEFNG